MSCCEASGAAASLAIGLDSSLFLLHLFFFLALFAFLHIHDRYAAH
jgi:hypothetical protein